jgi:hypothetical protein
MNMLKGFQHLGCMLKLIESIYGLKQSPQDFYLNLKLFLELIGFESSVSDHVLDNHVICLIYLADMLLYAKDIQDIDDYIAKLIAAGMGLEGREEDVSGFLGVDNDQKYDGMIQMTQAGLAYQINKALNIRDKPYQKFRPCTDVQEKDDFRDLTLGTYNYASLL